MKEIYHEEFTPEDNNADVAHRVSGIVQQYRPSAGWKIGQISYEVGPQTTRLRVPLSKYDEPLEETTETYTVESSRRDEKISSLARAGYTDFQVIPSGNNVIIVTTRKFEKRFGGR